MIIVNTPVAAQFYTTQGVRGMGDLGISQQKDTVEQKFSSVTLVYFCIEWVYGTAVTKDTVKALKWKPQRVHH